MSDQSDLRRNRPRRRWRTGAFALGTAALATPLAMLGVNASVAAPDTPGDSPEKPSTSASPATAGEPLPEGIDEEALRKRMTRGKAAGNTADPDASSDAIRVTESEEAGASGNNDRTPGAERVPRPEKQHGGEVQIDGTLDTEVVKPQSIEPNQEDDGAIPLARDLKLDEDRPGVTTTGEIGDGPHGSKGDATGDYDFYKFDASEGDTLTMDIDPDGELYPQVLLYDADGNLVIGAQDMTEGTGNAHLSFPIEQDGDYYIAVGNMRPADPFDSGSGYGVQTEGPYELTTTLQTEDAADTDVYAVPMRKGDVLGATVTGAAGRVAIYGPDGELTQASGLDLGLIRPDSSPLPGGGNATADHVAAETGLYRMAISDGSGDYSVTVGAHRPPSSKEQQQTIYLDFSGPTFDNRLFGESALEPGKRDLSPMRDFLPNWGLDKSDERAVVEATTERVREILHEDIPGSKVRVTNSLESPGLFGKPGVSRVMVSGTAEEAGLIPALGISESIDPGNFAREETAIVMLDRMSAPGDDNPASLNAYLTKDSDRIRAVAQALGNTAGHEAGHYLGNWHTDDHDEGANVMDTGNLLHIYALGQDGIAGTGDDDRVAMGTSRFEPLQGFAGTESSPTRTWAALR